MPGPTRLSPAPSPRGQQTRKPYTLEELTLAVSARTLRAAKELLLEYGQFVAAQPGIASFCYGALEQEAAALPQSYLDQAGGAMVAWVDQKPVGFIAWRALGTPELADAWELKRLWIRPQARGLGVGKALVQSVLDRARVAQKTTVLLDTAPDSMAPAYRLYLEMGFQICPPYNGAGTEGITYMRKSTEKP